MRDTRAMRLVALVYEDDGKWDDSKPWWSRRDFPNGYRVTADATVSAGDEDILEDRWKAQIAAEYPGMVSICWSEPSGGAR